MQLTPSCVSRTRRSAPANGEFCPWRCTAGTPRRSDTGLLLCAGDAPIHTAAPCPALTSARNSTAAVVTADASITAIIAEPWQNPALTAPKPRLRRSTKQAKGITGAICADESQASNHAAELPSGFSEGRDDDANGAAAAATSTPTLHMIHDWREPDQTLVLEASTSPSSSSRTLVPLPSRRLRPAPRRPASQYGAASNSAPVQGTPYHDTAISRNSGGRGRNAVASPPSASKNPAEMMAATTKAAAAAAVAAKRRARAAAGVALAGAALAAIRAPMATAEAVAAVPGVAGEAAAAGSGAALRAAVATEAGLEAVAAAAGSGTGAAASRLSQAVTGYATATTATAPADVKYQAVAKTTAMGLDQGHVHASLTQYGVGYSSSSNTNVGGTTISRNGDEGNSSIGPVGELPDATQGVSAAVASAAALDARRLTGREAHGSGCENGLLRPSSPSPPSPSPLKPPLSPAARPPPPPPRSAAELQRQVKGLRRSGRLAAALELSYMGMSYFPLVRSFWASAASLELRVGRVTVARELLDEALRRWPNNTALLLVLGLVHANRRDYDAASYAFRTALEREPGNAVVLHAWATVEASRGDLSAAGSRFRAATQANPDMVHSYTSWARMAAAAGDEAAATRLFQEGYAADPMHVPLLHAWATFELNRDKQSTARKLLTQALQLDPYHVPSWMAIGSLEWRQGNPAKAREVFERGLSMVGPSAPLISALAELELRSSNTKNARELFARLRITAPSHIPALLSEAKMEHRAGNRTRAQQLYGEAAAALAAGVVRGSEGGGLKAPRPLPPPPSSPPLLSQGDGAATAVATAAAGRVEPLGSPAASLLQQQEGVLQQQQQQQQQEQQRRRRQQEHIADESGVGGGGGTSYAAVLHAWAQLHLAEGDVALAEELLAAVEAVEPNNGHMCYTRGLLCQREGALAAAEQWFRRGLVCRTSRDGALLCYEGFAELLAFQGRKDEARGVWQAGTTAVQTPTSRFLRQAALFEKKERNHAAAAALFAAAVRRDPQDYRSWLQWGVFESRQRNWDAAERCFQQGTAVAPGYPYLWLAYASSLVVQRRIPDARAVLRTATQHCPRHAQLWMEWALMEAAAGDADAARRLFEKGAEVPPNYQHEPLYQAWGAFEEKMGNRAFSKQLLQRAEQVSQAHRARRLAADKKTAGSGTAASAVSPS